MESYLKFIPKLLKQTLLGRAADLPILKFSIGINLNILKRR